ncbi:AraC family transcriptional regulator [Pelomonas sp. Root1217]|uniref:AraC family transcriptional regulator n=1 Tax=Pelomonas sp. Root1217 TaxID=1736430 RepID=UPI00070E35EB|nr:AraC family transcriptional regulator [Pelomonas sp. Root1217]KQV49515.1 AraC family transcriptional regulator [Pelomonas sp. Root1217]
MDPLSQVLSLLNTEHSFFAGVKAAGSWAVRFPPPEGFKFHAVLQGACWLAVDGVPGWREVRAGDCYLITRRSGYTLASHPDVTPLDGPGVFAGATNNVLELGAGDEFFLIGGRFDFRDDLSLLLGSLPPLALLPGSTPQAEVLQWSLQRLGEEMSQPSPGTALVVQNLAHLMLVQFLRLYLTAEPMGPGWLRVLGDDTLRPAVQAIHTNPERRWTVETLARLAAVSRSTFAQRFKQAMGMGPLEYVLRWRMLLAARELRQADCSVSSVAERLGYDSDSAFSKAFKRVMACSPSRYRQQQAMAS